MKRLTIATAHGTDGAEQTYTMSEAGLKERKGGYTPRAWIKALEKIHGKTAITFVD